MTVGVCFVANVGCRLHCVRRCCLRGDCRDDGLADCRGVRDDCRWGDVADAWEEAEPRDGRDNHRKTVRDKLCMTKVLSPKQ